MKQKIDIRAIQALEEKLKQSRIIVLLKIWKLLYSTLLFNNRKQNIVIIKVLKYKIEF